MKIVEPSIEIFFHYPLDGMRRYNNAEEWLELAGRTCYKSEDSITKDSAPKFVKKLSDLGHHAMLEHSFASARIICDRGVTHELVRHRLASYAQESTRYCNYRKDKFGNEISVIQPPGLDEYSFLQWNMAMKCIEESYMNLIEHGVPPQIARSVLPICIKTEIVISANLREWLHIFNLRTSNKAHPQIRELMLKALRIFSEEIPSMYEDLWNERKPK